MELQSNTALRVTVQPEGLTVPVIYTQNRDGNNESDNVILKAGAAFYAARLGVLQKSKCDIKYVSVRVLTSRLALVSGRTTIWHLQVGVAATAILDRLWDLSC